MNAGWKGLSYSGQNTTRKMSNMISLGMIVVCFYMTSVMSLDENLRQTILQRLDLEDELIAELKTEIDLFKRENNFLQDTLTDLAYRHSDTMATETRSCKYI